MALYHVPVIFIILSSSGQVVAATLQVDWIVLDSAPVTLDWTGSGPVPIVDEEWTTSNEFTPYFVSDECRDPRLRVSNSVRKFVTVQFAFLLFPAYPADADFAAKSTNPAHA